MSELLGISSQCSVQAATLHIQLRTDCSLWRVLAPFSGPSWLASTKSESLNFERWALCKNYYPGNYCNHINLKAGLYFVNILEKFEMLSLLTIGSLIKGLISGVKSIGLTCRLQRQGYKLRM